MAAGYLGPQHSSGSFRRVEDGSRSPPLPMAHLPQSKNTAQTYPLLTMRNPLVGRRINGTVQSSFIADAKFEVLGAPYSLLSASLSASQILYTRRGTLVGVSGKAENVRASNAILLRVGLANGSRLFRHFPCLSRSVDLFWGSHSFTKRSTF